MNILKLSEKIRRYAKDIFLLPTNMHRLIERQSSAQAEGVSKSAHRAIINNLSTVKAQYSEGFVRLDGANYIIDPARTIETLNEVILRRDYDFNWTGGNYVVIDIGMNVGFATVCKARDPNVVHVYGFEPLLPTYRLARRNIEVNPELVHKITTFNIGLSNAEEMLEIKYCENEIMSISSEGTFDTCFRGNINIETIAIKPAAAVLGEIFERHPNVPIFLKCDCEGAEFKIFRSLRDAGLMEKISIVIVEWHGAPPDELITILTTCGFSCFSQVINVEWNVGMIRAVRTSWASTVQK